MSTKCKLFNCVLLTDLKNIWQYCNKTIAT